MTPQEVDDFIEHFGRKGMHWGEHIFTSGGQTPAQSRTKELAKVNRKIDKIDADKAVAGYALRGWAAQKKYNKVIKKDPGFAFKKLTPEEKTKWERQASRRVTRSVMTRGALEVGLVLGGGHYVNSKIPASRNTKAGTEVALILLAGQMGAMRVSELNAIRVSNKLDELQGQRKALGGG